MNSGKFHIRSDMEGVTGVVSMAQVTPNAPEYAEARGWYMAELLALIDGLFAGGAREISVYDQHWFGRSVDMARIPKGVRIFSGKPSYRAGWTAGLDASHSGMILHGLHSMEESGYTLCHTYEPDFLQTVSLNGITVGEIGIEAAIAGDWGVPMPLVIADSSGAEEAKALIKGVVTVATKISCLDHGAECLPLSETTELIRKAAAEVASNPPDVKPFCPGNPAELKCVFKAGRFLEGLRRRKALHWLAHDTLLFNGPTPTAVWAEYWELKRAIQAEIGIVGAHNE
jgi:D-amino peptidase